MKPLSDALGEALALVGKATPGRWFSDQHSPCNEGMEDNPDVSLWGQDGDAESFVCNIAFDWSRASDAEAVAAAVNLLRQHGEALAAIVRAVEGAARITAEGREFRLVPLDAAGSAEGRGDANG